MKRIGVIGTAVITCVRECRKTGQSKQSEIQDSRVQHLHLKRSMPRLQALPLRGCRGKHRPAVSILQADISSHINRIRFPKDFGGDLDAFSPIAILRQGMNRPTKKRSLYEPCAADASFAQCARLGSYGMLSQLCRPSARYHKD